MKRILCYGDSNTYGLSLAPVLRGLPPERFDEDTRWTCRLEKELGEGYRVYEAGLNGRTTVYEDVTVPGRNGYESLEVVFKMNDPCDLIVLMLGTNDVRAEFRSDAYLITCGLARIVLRLKELIARSMNPNARVMIVAPPAVVPMPENPFCYSNEAAEEIKKLSQFYEILSKDLGCAFADAGQWCSGDGTGDGVHLSAEGHKVMAERLAPLVRAAIEQAERDPVKCTPVSSMFLRG